MTLCSLGECSYQLSYLGNSAGRGSNLYTEAKARETSNYCAVSQSLDDLPHVVPSVSSLVPRGQMQEYPVLVTLLNRQR